MKFRTFSIGLFLVSACAGSGADSGPDGQSGAGGGFPFGGGGGGAIGTGGGGNTPNGGTGSVAQGGAGNTGNTGNVPGGGGASPGSGGSESGGSAGSGAGPGSGGAQTCSGSPENVACSTTSRLTIPSDPSQRGPWVVGVRTVKIGRLTAEVVYPAAPGSEAGKQEATYDVRDWLPSPNPPANVSNPQFTPIADSESPAVKPIGGNLYRDLPLDECHGPYPVVVFMHGTASFRVASGSLNVLWASRGFVVIAADYPGLMLADQLCSAGCGCTPSGAADYAGDITSQINAVKSPSGDLAFLTGHVDATRIALSGHSVGGCTVALLGADPGVQTVIPLSETAAVPAGGTLKSSMIISGMSDTVFAYKTGSLAGIGNVVCPAASPTVQDAYTASAGPPGVKKRVVGVTGGGHLLPTDLCQKNTDGNNAIQVLHNHHYCGVDQVAIIGLPALFDCGAAGFDWQTGVKDVGYASTAALEETLMCTDETANFAAIKTANPTIGDFSEAK
ncbi:MAG TPA: hypothetical protein VHE30_18175 [Polyangiaceae bacterium]|nr:hypothetical protein [Polyangiaceae bacterium]